MAAPELTLRPAAGEAEAARRGRLLDVAAIAVAAAATLALVLPYYADRPFWFDELVSLEVAGLAPRDLAGYVLGQEANMALYHALLGGWLEVVDAEAGVRALSIAFALVTLPFLYAIARRLFDRRTAVTAVLLMSVNVSFVGYSRDARGYALALLLTTASSLFLVRSVEHSRRLDWALYVVAAAAAIWAHLFAGLVVAAQVAWLLLVARPSVRREGRVALLVLAALVAPLVLAILVGDQRAQLDWLPRPGPLKLPGLFEWFVESRLTLVVYFVGAAVALVAALTDWRAERTGPPRRESLLLLWLLVPPAAAFLVSFATPVYLYRYFLVCLPALVLLVAAGLARLRPAWLGIALTIAALLLSARTVQACQPDCKIRHDDWGAAMRYLDSRARSGDAIVVYPEQVRTGVHAHLPEPRPALLFPERWEIRGGASEGADDLAQALDAAASYERVWLVAWWLPADPARDALSSRAELLSAREFQGDVHVELYRPREPAG